MPHAGIGVGRMAGVCQGMTLGSFGVIYPRLQTKHSNMGGWYGCVCGCVCVWREGAYLFGLDWTKLSLVTESGPECVGCACA